jgi:hypothetical protein
MKTLSAIPIQAPMIDGILDGYKKWEIRSKFTKKIGPVALIRAKSGTVVGTAMLAEVIQLTPELAYENTEIMGFRPLTREEAKELDGQYAWVLKDVVKLKTPVPYKHPSGAVTWVTLDEVTTNKVLEEADRSLK